MPRCLTIQRTLVTPPDRAKFAERLRAQARRTTRRRAAASGSSRRPGCRGAFLEFFEAPRRGDARAGARVGAGAGARSGAHLPRSGVRLTCRPAPSPSTDATGASCPPAASRSTTATSSRSSSSRGTGDDREVRVTRYSPHGHAVARAVARRDERRRPRCASSRSRSRARCRPRPATRRDGAAADRPTAFVDLHMHSTASDGSRAPADVVRAAKAAGLAAIALTDHDTVAGLPRRAPPARSSVCASSTAWS